MTEAITDPIAESASRPVRCPRCGYDQRGVIDAWREQCPPDGVCTECGLEWPWAEVFNPRLHRPRWCVEYGRILAFPKRAITTFLTSLLPWRFWRTLQMHHEISWARIVAYPLTLTILMAYLAISIRVGTSAYRNWAQIDAQLTESSRQWTLMSAAEREHGMQDSRDRAERSTNSSSQSGFQ